nr:DUF2808 domain-containing protein [Petrachloros mirabilis]
MGKSWMGQPPLWTSGLLGIASVVVGVSASAVQLADGTTHFVQIPRLESASTTFNGVWFRGAVYYFKISVPEGAGEPLQKVTVAQSEGVDRVAFNLAQTRVTDIRRRQSLAVATAQVDAAGAVTVVFDPPLAPGQTVMLGLRPYRNPSVGGVYLFGVTAFPAGEQPQGRFLGFGRLHFYERSRWGLFH